VSGRAIVVAAVLSWLGFFIHNLADLPARALIGAETLGPTAVYLLLAAGLWSRMRRVAAWLLLAWGWLHLVGGAALSVLPLPIWPFRPAQTLYHYGFHALYGAAQVPLLVTLMRQLKRGA